MSTAKTKKLMRRRQKGSLQRSDTRRDARSDARRDISSRSRANAIIRPANASPQVSKPAALRRATASRDLKPLAKRAIPSRSSKRDLATGRILFPVDHQGKIQYLPIASEATPQELKLGLFVANDSVQQNPVNSPLDPATEKRPFVQEVSTGRTLFPTLNAKGKREYLPQKSEATALELSRGKYIDDDAISRKAPLGTANAMSPLSPTYDLGKGRQVYAVKTPAGKTLRLPRESEADGWERTQGLFIPDDIVDAHERQRPVRQDNAAAAAQSQRRAQRAARLPAGVTRQPDRPRPPAPARRATDVI